MLVTFTPVLWMVDQIKYYQLQPVTAWMDTMDLWARSPQTGQYDFGSRWREGAGTEYLRHRQFFTITENSRLGGGASIAQGITYEQPIMGAETDGIMVGQGRCLAMSGTSAPASIGATMIGPRYSTCNVRIARPSIKPRTVRWVLRSDDLCSPPLPYAMSMGVDRSLNALPDNRRSAPRIVWEERKDFHVVNSEKRWGRGRSDDE
ncbi:hypothetical protein BD779DRAFT_1475382 [Infundibulicybe gibba]|nr:hypothetical protein BD779DRAFT_1475382 [Infundibulicybe gibba]